LFDQAANSLPQVKADRLQAHAVTAKTHLTAAPEIPTVDEAGLPPLLHRDMAWALGAQGHTARDHRQA